VYYPTFKLFREEKDGAKEKNGTEKNKTERGRKMKYWDEETSQEAASIELRMP